MQQIIKYRGVRLNQRTIDMIEAAEKILGFKLRLTQGSYNAGGVAKSAGTHDGGGAVDIALKDAVTGALFPKVRREAIRAAARQVGFAAWIRDPSQADWPWHTHCIAVGDPDLSRDAADQVVDYRNNRNGLASNGRDDGPRTWVGVTWEKYKAAHPNTEDLTMADISELIEEMKRQGDATRALIKSEGAAARQETRRQQIWGLRYGLQIADDLETAADRYDATLKAGGTVDQAEAAYSASVAEITADLAARAQANG